MFPVRIAEQATKSKFFWVDDVWVTGILGTVPTTTNSFNYEQITYRDAKANCRHLKKLTCEETLRQGFISRLFGAQMALTCHFRAQKVSNGPIFPLQNH